jgi:hypothetical protein
MAGDAHPWRDIYANADWDAIVDKTSNPPALGRRNRDIKDVTNLISSYHLIPKDHASLFPDRIRELRRIETSAQGYIAGLGPAAQTNKPAAGKDPAGRLEPWVVSLAKRAAKKAGYLATLGEWVRDAKPKHKDFAQLADFLVKLRQDGNVRGDREELLSLVPYGKMEKYDPYHRSITFFLHEDPGGDVLVEPRGCMGTAFNEWLAFRLNAPPGRNAKATFYEWLEYHPICTGTPGVTRDFDPAYKNDVRRVSYDPRDLSPLIVRANDGLYIDQGAGGGLQKLDTARDFPSSGKGPSGAAAFAWDEDGALYAHQHVARQFYHSSFTAGAKIRCSGMIKVVNGLVRYVSNQSGHYAPRTRQLYYFVEYLSARAVLASAAKVEDKTLGGFGPIPWADFRQHGLNKFGPYNPNAAAPL